MTDEAWKSTKGWDPSVKSELKDVVETFRPVTNGHGGWRCCKDVPYFNILLTGQIGSGKSSFYNSINSIFTGYINSSKADSGDAAQSLTKEYHVYEIRTSPDKDPLGWRLCDSMGLDENSTESEIRNLLKATEGHVPNRYKFTPGHDFTDEVRDYFKNPTLADKAHCVAVVIDAKRAYVLKDNMWSKLRSLREGLISRNIPTFVLLSHIDEACAETSQSVDRVLRSVRIRKIVSHVSKMLMGLPENQIFPIKNYNKEVELQNNIDILLLNAMNQMLIACKGHIENEMEKDSGHLPNCIVQCRAKRELKDVVESLRPVTNAHGGWCCCKVDVPYFNILLTGQIGSGKSSFYNSINSIFTGYINSSKADSGDAAQSLTKEYHVYEIRTSPYKDPLGWRLCDSMGLDENSTESEIRNLLKATEGHVPNRYKFTPGHDFTDEVRDYFKNPTLADKAHCVAVVIDAKRAYVLKDNMWSKLRSLREGLISRNIPTFVLLSHIDEACAETSQSVDRVLRSVRIRDIVSHVSKMLMNLPEKQIFPLKNYSKEVELENSIDILLLNAMHQMLIACQGHIENEIEKDSGHLPRCIVL